MMVTVSFGDELRYYRYKDSSILSGMIHLGWKGMTCPWRGLTCSSAQYQGKWTGTSKYKIDNTSCYYHHKIN